MKKFVIVGLGLIGGSMALALRGFEDYTIVGVDVSQPTLRFARERGVCDRVTEDAGEAIEGADVVMLAIHPQGILDFLKAYRDRFKPGCLVTDVCGVKSAIMVGAECLPEGWISSAATPWRARNFPVFSMPLPRCFRALT